MCDSQHDHDEATSYWNELPSGINKGRRQSATERKVNMEVSEKNLCGRNEVWRDIGCNQGTPDDAARHELRALHSNEHELAKMQQIFATVFGLMADLTKIHGLEGSIHAATVSQMSDGKHK